MDFVEAEFQDGVLRLRSPLHLRPGERVRILVMRRADPERWDLAKLAATGADDVSLAQLGLDEWSEGLDREQEG